MGVAFDGSDELRQLVELLRLGADTARRIAATRHLCVTEIGELADRAEAMALELEEIVLTYIAANLPRPG